MIGKSPNQNEGGLFRPLLKDFIDMNHKLVLLSERIEWRDIEREFTPPYSSTGSLAMPIRFMTGCMMPKHIYNLGDETLVYDREGCGAREIIGIKVITPGKPKKSDTAYDRKKKRHPFRRRADIEPVVGHLKADHRMRADFLSGREPASVNAMRAATGWNLRRMMNDLARKSARTLFVLLQILYGEPRYS